VSPQRRAWLQRLAAGATVLALPRAQAQGGPLPAPQARQQPQAQPQPQAPGPDDDPIRHGRPLVFPRDHGAHLGARTEWWYATGWLSPGGDPTGDLTGFQVTFFRSRTDLAAASASRFAPRQLLFAHAALTLPAQGLHPHAQRIVRWNGDPAAAGARAAVHDADIAIGSWQLRRDGDTWRSRIPTPDFSLDLALQRSQPLLLQGDAGFSRKGPEERQASHYYSEPQLQARAAITLQGRRPGSDLSGRAWLDQEWSEEILHPEAVGWDWIGMNLLDGSALTAFQLRRADGSAVWAGGSFRAAGGPVRSFAPDELRFSPGRRWTSPATNATYPVTWTVDSPAGRHTVRSLMDAQELDGDGSTGSVYWEGLSELVDEQGRRVGLGYLEMTGYTAPLQLR
jgi:predicted secreted hydrolase